MWKIIGQYKGWDREEVDHAWAEEDANILAAEYRLAFGVDWTIWVEH